jgi:hypothetical protein
MCSSWIPRENFRFDSHLAHAETRQPGENRKSYWLSTWGRQIIANTKGVRKQFINIKADMPCEPYAKHYTTQRNSLDLISHDRAGVEDGPYRPGYRRNWTFWLVYKTRPGGLTTCDTDSKRNVHRVKNSTSMETKRSRRCLPQHTWRSWLCKRRAYWNMLSARIVTDCIAEVGSCLWVEPQISL